MYYIEKHLFRLSGKPIKSMMVEKMWKTSSYILFMYATFYVLLRHKKIMLWHQPDNLEKLQLHVR